VAIIPHKIVRTHTFLSDIKEEVECSSFVTDKTAFACKYTDCLVIEVLFPVLTCLLRRRPNF